MVRTKNRIRPTTSSQSKKLSLFYGSPVANEQGFTLIEILMVLGIVVLVLNFGIPVVSRITGQNINTSARKLISLVRGVRTDAILLNSIYRIKLDLEDNTYLVESQKQPGLLSESSLLSVQPDPKAQKNAPAPTDDGGFAPADKYFKEPMPLPRGVAFKGILKEKEGTVVKGLAYIYFFPNGLNEKAILYLNSSTAKEGGYSLYIHPTAGKVEFFKTRVNEF